MASNRVVLPENAIKKDTSGLMRPLLIKGGRIIDPGQGIDQTGSLLVAEGKIKWLGKGKETPPESDCEVLPADGLVVCPGFIDLHCHLREPGFEEKETIATGSEAAARGGFTTICCMPNTNPPLDNPKAIEYVKAKATKDAIVRVLPIGCVTKGRQGKEIANLPELAAAGVIGFSDDGDPVPNVPLMRQTMEYSRDLYLPVIDHCEDKTRTKGGVVNDGEISIQLGLPGIPASAEENIVTRDLALAEMTGGWLHLAHVSTAGSVALIREAREKGVWFTAEVTPHHLTLTEEIVSAAGTNAKVNPPLRTKNDVQALVQALKDNLIDIIATDHAPHTEADKKLDMAKAPFGISGLETALGSLLGLVHSGALPLTLIIAKLTSEPSKILGEKCGQLGTLAIGATADITIFDPEQEWVVDTSHFASKGKNTPLAGTTLKGKVIATIFGGNIAYTDEKILRKRK
ncbi:MAG: dihydroorotase [Chloroflexota bacterium]